MKEALTDKLKTLSEAQLAALVTIAQNFTEKELTKIAVKVKNPTTKKLIVNYL